MFIPMLRMQGVLRQERIIHEYLLLTSDIFSCGAQRISKLSAIAKIYCTVARGMLVFINIPSTISLYILYSNSKYAHVQVAATLVLISMTMGSRLRTEYHAIIM